MFNQYFAYCCNAEQLNTSASNRILVSIDRIQKLEDYDDVINFVSREFGDVEKERIFTYDNDIMVVVSKEEDAVVVGAFQNGKQMFGTRWFSENYNK